jgi:hypothetical protein
MKGGEAFRRCEVAIGLKAASPRQALATLAVRKLPERNTEELSVDLECLTMTPEHLESAGTVPEHKRAPGRDTSCSPVESESLRVAVLLVVRDAKPSQ